MTTQDMYRECCSTIIEECSQALHAVDPQSVSEYLKMVTSARCVFFVGVGRVLLSLEAIAKRYVHLGIPAVVVGQITEPAITADDVLVVGSGSGETFYPAGIAQKAKEAGARIIHIGSNPESPIHEITDLFVRIPVESKMKRSDEIRSFQPMTSLFEQSLLLFGDATAMMIIKKKDLVLSELWKFHANLE